MNTVHTPTKKHRTLRPRDKIGTLGDNINQKLVNKEAFFPTVEAKKAGVTLATLPKFKETLIGHIGERTIIQTHERHLTTWKLAQIPFPEDQTDASIIENLELVGYKCLSISAPAWGKKVAVCATPDHELAQKALDQLYRIMGVYEKDTDVAVRELDRLTDEELLALIEEQKKDLNMPTTPQLQDGGKS